MAEPLTLRYNNPGAVEFKPWMTQYGARLGPNGRYAQFDSPDQGYQVMGRVLDTYRDKHGLNTVTGIINRWAPANVDNNSTSSYAASVAKSLGIEPNAPLTPEQRPSLMRAMASYEAGRAPAALPAPMPLGHPPAQAAPAPAPTGASPMADPYRPQQRGGFLGLIDALQGGMSSPLFQSGAAMYSAASQGKDIGTGFLIGGEAAGRAAKSQAEQAKMQRETMAQQQRDQMWQQLTSGQTPAWASGLPAGTLDLAKALGPEAGLELVSRLALAKPDKTGTQKDYEYAKSQGFAGSLMDFTKAQNESKRPVTNIDMKGETSFSQEAGKATAKRYSDLAEQGQAARAAQGDIDRLDELGAAIGTQGAVANVKAALGPYANALGVKIDGLDDIQAFSSIVSRLAPTMRPPGSGATSDFEFKQFLNALPQLAQTTEGRKLVLDQMRAMNAYKAQLGELSERVLSGEIDRKTADAEIRKLGNPLTLWRQGAQAMPPSQPAPAPAQGAGRFAQPQMSPAGAMVDSVRKQIQSGQVQVPQIVEQARRAIQEGKDPARIRERLQQYGIDPASVGL